jgi:hypothetical protein
MEGKINRGKIETENRKGEREREREREREKGQRRGRALGPAYVQFGEF